MSKVSVEKIKCPKCGKELQANIYDSINVNLNPELKDKLLNNELTNVHCDCGQSITLIYPILYHKMGIRSVMIEYTKSSIEVAMMHHQLVKQFCEINLPKSGFQFKEIFSKKGIDTDDVFEVYNDWTKFIDRIREIG